MLKLLSGLVIWRGLAVFLLITSLISAAHLCSAQNYGPLPPASTLIPTTKWTGQSNQFVTATIEDATGWWWGTDNDGLWHYAPEAKPGFRWEHFRAEDGLYDDSITSLCIDLKGRLWVGTERRGVSVYNNSWWQNYDVMSGPLGVHVTSITLNPRNGDIWIASESGIAIYSDKTQKWRYISEVDGLGSNQINCVAFLSSGEAIVGSADDGLFLASPSNNYSTWSHVVANPAAPASETGSGLCSNQINCLLVNKSNKIFCGTSSGLTFSADSGKTWSYLHGYMWQVKIKRQVRNSFPVTDSGTVLPLSDDYISALAYDQNGFVYIGHNHGGLEVVDDSDGSQQYHTKLNVYGTDIKSLTLLSRGSLLIGNYGSGVSTISWTNAKTFPEVGPIMQHKIETFPAPAQTLTIADLTKLATSLKAIGVNAAKAAVPAATPSTTPATQPSTAPPVTPTPTALLSTRMNLGTSAPTPTLSGYFLGEDWQTQGSWIGRYGSEYAILCGADDANKDFILGDQTQFSVSGSIGLTINGSTTPSHWLQWEQSGDPRVLYDPEVHVRRESEWDDQGDQDERLIEGPDIWLTVQVPAGIHRISLYFMNKDGHTRTTRFRDYILQLIPAQSGVDFHQSYDSPILLPAIAETRVENFWPGAYETFAVTGPGVYYVKIDKNYSINTIVQGVFIDKLDTTSSVPTLHLPPLTTKIIALWSQLDSLYGTSASAPYQRIYRIQLLRAATAVKAPKTLLTNWRLKLGLWNDTDWASFNHKIDRPTAALTVAPKT